MGGGLQRLPPAGLLVLSRQVAASRRLFRYGLVAVCPYLCAAARGRQAWAASCRNVLPGPAVLLRLRPLPPRRRVGRVWAAPWCPRVSLWHQPQPWDRASVWHGWVCPQPRAPTLHPQPAVQAPACSLPEHWEVWGQLQPRSLGVPSPRCLGSRAAHPRS